MYNTHQNTGGGQLGGGSAIASAGRLNPALGQSNLGGLGKSIADIGAKITATRDQSVLTSNTISLQKDLSDLKLAYQQRQDYPNFQSDYQKDIANLRDKYSKSSPSRAVSAAFGPIFQREAANGSIALNGIIRTKQIEQAKGLYIQDRNNLLELAGRSTTPDAVGEYIQKNSDILKSRVANGLINPEDAVVNDLSFKDQAWSNMAQQLIHNNPQQALAMLSDKSQMPGIQERTRNVLLAKATTAVKDAKTTDVYQQLSDKYPDNPLKAGQEIIKPEAMKKYGLDIRQAAFLKSTFDSEYNQQREISARQQQASREAWSTKINDAIMHNDLLGASRLIGESNLDGETKRRIFDGIKKRQFETDPRALVGLYEKIDSGQITERYQIDRELGHGIGPQDVVKLNSYLKKARDEGKDKHNYYDDVRYKIKLEAKQHEGRTQLTKLQPEFELLVRQEAERQHLSKYDPKILDIATKLLEYHDRWFYQKAPDAYQFEDVLAGRTDAAQPAAAPAQGDKTLTEEEAAALLKEAGGDKAKARELAIERGYNF